MRGGMDEKASSSVICVRILDQCHGCVCVCVWCVFARENFALIKDSQKRNTKETNKRKVLIFYYYKIYY